MELPNVKELERLLKMCRKQGVTDLTMGEMSFKFGDLPSEQPGEAGELEAKPSDEELLYWSAQPDPLEGRQ